MKTAIAQIKLKTGDFNFNYENIIKNIENTDCDLLVFPSASIENLGGKDLIFDKNCFENEAEMFEKIAERN